MTCHGCGHEFARTLTRCPRCHRSTSKRGRASTDSRLLEFPKRTRVAPPAETVASPLPAWRVELNEKVRAIRARRNRTDSQAPPDNAQVAGPFDVEPRTAVAATKQDQPQITYPRNAASRVAAPSPEVLDRPATPVVSARRTSTNIVEAALNRVKRASEHASRAALPKIEPVRPMPTGAQAVRALDREATARALEPAPVFEQKPEPFASPRPELVQRQISKPARIETRQPERQRPEPVAAAASAVAEPAYSEDLIEQPPTLAIDDIEPVDYLEAEVRKVDQALSAGFLRNESPAIATHAVILFADAIAVAASCSPFLAIIRIVDGSFASAQTRFASGAIVALIAFFYLALTQTLCGRTFGMMLTNTRVVDSQNFEAPSASRALMRSAGYFISAAPAMLGIVWAAFNRKRRGWHDFISGTMVVRDF